MDIRTLRYFDEIARAGTISKAAENLHISQPPLSRSMQLLEEELGVPLFIRGKRRITLTPEGQFLRKRAEQMIALADMTLEQIGEMSGKVTGKVYLGSNESISLGMMPRMLMEFHKLYPEVQFHWWSGNSNDVLDRLEHGLLDFAVVRTPCDKEKFQFRSLMREPWMAYLNMDQYEELVKAGKITSSATLSEEKTLSGTSGWERSSAKISLEGLEGIPLIIPAIKGRAKEISDWFGKRNIEPQICCEISPAMNAIALVEEGMGVAILPQSAESATQGKHIVVCEIINPSMESEIIIASNKNIRLSAAATRFIEYICEHVKEY